MRSLGLALLAALAASLVIRHKPPLRISDGTVGWFSAHPNGGGV